MGDRLGTPGVVDFSLPVFLNGNASNATSKSEWNRIPSDRKISMSQIKKSKLNLVTAFKVCIYS